MAVGYVRLAFCALIVESLCLWAVAQHCCCPLFPQVQFLDWWLHARCYAVLLKPVEIPQVQLLD